MMTGILGTKAEEVQRKPELGAPASAPLVGDSSRDYVTA